MHPLDARKYADLSELLQPFVRGIGKFYEATAEALDLRCFAAWAQKVNRTDCAPAPNSKPLVYLPQRSPRLLATRMSHGPLCFLPSLILGSSALF
mmetsp:Transcript_9997/g.24917  ORF Transcript_9997/g.24917 Transcript_9997/m.24917 type:complete len:95 (-) Transcript_9997:9-293(-)